MLFDGSKERIEVVGEDADLLTMGITPSGKGILHMGHYVTIFNLLRSLEAHDGQKAKIFIDDREFNTQVVPSLPSEDLTAAIEQQLRGFIQDAGTFLLDSSLVSRVEIQRMSDFFRDKGVESESMGEDLLNLLANNKATFVRFFAKMRLAGIKGIRPMCNDCGQGKISHKTVRMTNPGVLSDNCGNQRCDSFGKRSSVDIVAGDTRWSLFYTLVGMRDLLLHKENDAGILHVYGGDYALPWAHHGTVSNVGAPKAARISGVISELLTGEIGVDQTSVNHYVGPLLTYRGDKLSKTKGNGVTHFNFEDLSRILDGRNNEVKICTLINTSSED